MIGIVDKWDVETDLVVVGYGAAVAAAAITAHDKGVGVVILEKMAQGGGNSRASGGNIIIPRSKEFVKYLETLSFNTTGRDIIETFVDGAMRNGDWIREIGGDVQVFVPLAVAYPESAAGASFPQVAGADAAVKYVVKGGAQEGPPGTRLWRLLSGAVEKRGIRVMVNTPARELIRGPNGPILGVIAEAQGKALAIKARRGVVLASGGFENDQALKWDYLPVKPLRFLGNPGNTGDTVRLVQKIGGDLWHMTRLSCTVGFQAPEFEAAFFITFLSPGFIFVDKRGRRFVNEAGIEIHEYHRDFSYFDVERMEFPRSPIWAVFDEPTRRKGPLVRSTAGYNRDYYQWSLDNSKEIAKGWIMQGKSIARLAGQMAIPPPLLEETVNKYNDCCTRGVDPDFGRRREHLRTLEAPFYAIQLWPTLINTQGGPRRDREARVLDPDGKPIPRLYAAGEAGSIWGFLYQGACNIGEALVFGRIAGANAAGEQPW